MHRKVLHIIGILHIVIAVNCMLAGVIVEFHQVHVYKNNISFWQLQATKTVGKDTKKYVQPITDFVRVLQSGFDVDDLRPSADDLHFQLFENTIYSRNLFDLISPEFLQDKNLRGPPRIA